MILFIGYFLFFLLVWIGYDALKPRVFDPRKIFILPLIFLVWSIWNLIAGFQGITDLIVWAVFILLGYAAGKGLTQSLKVRADKQKGYMGLPGSPLILVLVLIFFGIRYIIGYFPEANQKILHNLLLVLTSIITGIFIGRTFTIMKKYAKAKHEKLRKK